MWAPKHLSFSIPQSEGSILGGHQCSLNLIQKWAPIPERLWVRHADFSRTVCFSVREEPPQITVGKSQRPPYSNVSSTKDLAVPLFQRKNEGVEATSGLPYFPITPEH